MEYKIIIFILLIILVIITLFKIINNNIILEFFQSKTIIDDDAFIKQNSIDIKDCENIINIGNKYNYDLDDEIVDNKPLYQIDVLHSRNIIVNKELWTYILPIYNNIILKNICQQNNKFCNLKLDFVFFRKYNSKERKDISIHTDNNALSINILLSNPEHYKGGDFYIFNKNITNNYKKYYENILEHNEDKKLEFINSFKSLPIVNMNQGDIIVYTGKNHLHGVLPVTSGTRYILSFFFEK